jgi:serine/threonine protein kinase
MNILPKITHVKKLQCGKQGKTGLLMYNESSTDLSEEGGGEGQLYVYKISTYMNFLVDHEATVMDGFSELHPACPNFCRLFKKIKYPVHPNFREDSQDPFEAFKKPIWMDVLLTEYIQDSICLLDLIEDKSVPIEHIICCVKQVVLAVSLAQRHNRFVHYDLHAVNILLEKCDPHMVLVYKFDEDNIFCVPTNGYLSKIIDFGFSRSDYLNEKPMYCSLAFTDAGYMAPAYDAFADAKILLSSVAQDFKEIRGGCSEGRKFKHIVRNLFMELPIDWESGWDVRDVQPISDELLEYIENDNEQSTLFAKYPHYCIDMLQSLIILPLQDGESDWKEFRKAYCIFVNEFIKIEYEINNSFYALYVLKFLIEKARAYYEPYIAAENKQEIAQLFSRDVFGCVNEIAKFCHLKTVNFEVILCSIYIIKANLEYKLFNKLDKLLRIKHKEYSKLQVANLEQIYPILDVNFEWTYQFTPDTLITIYDFPEKCNYSMKLVEDECVYMNSAHQLSKGMALLDIYNDIEQDEDIEDI